MMNVAENEQVVHKGFLHKWTNYLKGYQKRYFILNNGLLSYYRNPNEKDHSCRGTINLACADLTYGPDSLTFVITNKTGETFHLRALNESDRTTWINKIKEAKSKQTKDEESSDDDEEQAYPSKAEIQDTLRKLNKKLEALLICRDVLTKHYPALQKALTDLEKLSPTSQHDLDALPTKAKALNERASLYLLTSTSMIKACADFVELAQAQGGRWQKMLKSEHENRKLLETMVEQLARQQSKLEKDTFRVLSNSGLKPPPPPVAIDNAPQDSDESEDFQDAVEIQDFSDMQDTSPEWRNRAHIVGHSRSASAGSADSFLGPSRDNRQHSRESSSSSIEGWTKTGQKLIVSHPRKRRERIPSKPSSGVSLWSIVKNCIGKELSKIPMPVNFSEPLSMLQRLAEDFEYSDLLDQAAKCDDYCEQMVYVAAFTISSYANTASRTGKPFNPLLGETYEADRRDDFGWRLIAEQVSHHPPACAMYTEGRNWRAWQEFTMASKFRGKYLQIIPQGIAHLEFPKSGNHYTWRKVTTTVHNIILGNLWVDNHGDMVIQNHTTKDKCQLNYSAYSYFSRDKPRRVTGVITNKDGVRRYVLRGFWDDQIEGAKVINTNVLKGKTIYETGPHKLIWKRKLYPELSSCYNMTKFAVELNEPEDGVALTDTRFRPDQRQMEEGNFDAANKIKVLLEEKQRSTRKKREEEALALGIEGENWNPRWFKKTFDKSIDPNGQSIHVFTNEYWNCKEKQDWSRCPDIYISDVEKK